MTDYLDQEKKRLSGPINVQVIISIIRRKIA